MVAGTLAAETGVVGSEVETSGVLGANNNLVRTPLRVGNDETVAC